jgi:hypothetical protein
MDDLLWKMLASELGIPEVRELQRYLDGRLDFYEMGYGELLIEPYDSRGGRSRIYRLTHQKLGETLVSSSALKSVLHDLLHHLMK